MRKIFVLEFMTLDGVIQGPGGPGEDTSDGFEYSGWMGPYFKDEMGGKEMGEQMKETHGLLLGRKTYDIWVNFWPTHTDMWPQVNEVPKYVVSNTLENPTWENTTVLKSVEDIKKLKESDGPDLQLYGSANLVQTLFENDLVDEFWLKIFPITLGSGKRLFEKGTIPASFELLESKITPSGVIFTKYKRAGGIKIESVPTS